MANRKGIMLFKSFLFSITLVFSFLSYAQNNPNWKLITQEDGITIYRDQNYSEGIIPVKAIMEVPQSVDEIAAVILDTKRKAQWAPRVPAVTIIKKYHPYDIIEYAQLDFPWPFSDRYFIVRSAMTATPNKDRVVFHLSSVSEPYSPKSDDYVRGVVYNGGMELEKTGNNVRVTAHLFTDPKGSIPKWVVNMFSEKTSVKFMQSLRAQIARSLYSTEQLRKVSEFIYKASQVDSERLPAYRNKKK